MAQMISVVTKYVVFPGVFAYALMNIFKPSDEEIEEIRKKSKTNAQFSAVLRAAADPNSKPMYRQKAKEAHPAPEIVEEATKEKDHK